MKRKKILFVSYYYPPAAGQALPGTQRSVKFIRYMNRLDKYVLTIRPELYPDYFKLDHPGQLPINGEEIIRTESYDVFQQLVSLKNKLLFRKNQPQPPDSENSSGPAPKTSDGNNETESSLFQKAKDTVSEIMRYPDEANCWIWHAVKAGNALIKKEGIDYVFATGKPWSALLVAFLLKKKNAQLVIDFRDPWVNNPFETQYSGFRKKADDFFERKIVQKADWVVLNTDDLRTEFLTRYSKEAKEKFITLTNGFDEADFTKKGQKTKDKKKNGDDSTLVLTHAGLLYGLRDPISIFKALEQYYLQHEKANDDHITFQQLGDITLDYDYQKYAGTASNKKIFDNVGQVPYNTCLDYLAQSDVLLIIQPDTKTQIPSKLFEYIFLKKPILTIAPLDGALAVMIQKYNFGDIYDPKDIDGITKYFIAKVAEKKVKGYLNVEYINKDKFDVKNITAELENLLLNES
ncbi:MAG: hypothetical protein U9R57_10895 [Thermodesulfobacteriota bacterium]|nr:hypothetical protein [Thermodesulfobacteriota bacterium]